MALQATLRTAFATIKVSLPASVVVVISKGQTANGLRSATQSSSGLSELGDRGSKIGIVRVDASDMIQPADGATIKVDGDVCTVVQSHLDEVGALLWIDYMVTKPVTEE